MSIPDEVIEEVTEGDPQLVHDLSLMGPKESDVKRWILLRANRLLLSGSILLGVFAALLGTNVVWPFEMQSLLTETTAVQTLFNTLLSGTILLVSVVVSINSIVLSQDLTALDTQRNRVEGAMDFQEEVETVTGVDTCPAEPAAYLRLMLESVLERTDELRELQSERPDEKHHDEIHSYVHFLEGYTRLVDEEMADADPGSIQVLIVGLNYDYAGALHATRKLKTEFGDTLTDEERETLDHLGEVLKLFSVGHEYFKSLFYMREFGKLSKSLLYVALPVIVMISYVLLAVSAGQYPASTIPGLSTVTVFMMGAYSVALAPYVVLTAFVLRSATIATRSLATGPFVLSRERW